MNIFDIVDEMFQSGYYRITTVKWIMPVIPVEYAGLIMLSFEIQSLHHCQLIKIS